MRIGTQLLLLLRKLSLVRTVSARFHQHQLMGFHHRPSMLRRSRRRPNLLDHLQLEVFLLVAEGTTTSPTVTVPIPIS